MELHLAIHSYLEELTFTRSLVDRVTFRDSNKSVVFTVEELAQLLDLNRDVVAFGSSTGSEESCPRGT